MPEKTLKEKVEGARLMLEGVSTYHPSWDARSIEEALTALEGRVDAFSKPVIKEALEGYLEFLGNLPEADERPGLPQALSHLKKALEYFKEAPNKEGE